MKNLWAPWRIDYLVGKKEKGCIFCKYPKADKKKDKEHLVLHRGRHCFVILNKYPYANGHLMVIPFKHTSDLSRLSSHEHQEMMKLTAFCGDLLKKSVFAEGINIGMNLGEAAGAGIKEHLHMHVVPRWSADTNFLPLLSGHRVMVEYLEASYDRLKKTMKKMKRK